MTDKVILLTTCEDGAQAESMARSLVEKNLAACVNIVPGIRSVYRWKGEVEAAGEVLLIVKTGRALVQQVRAAIEQLHSYELPESVALPIVDGGAAYLEWLDQGLRAERS